MNISIVNNRPLTRRYLAPPLIALAAAASLASACSSEDPTPTLTPTVTPTATSTPRPTLVVPTPLPDDVLIENTRGFLSNEINSFEVDVDAEGDGRISRNCLEVLEGGPGGFEWSVERREDGQWVVRIDHTASLIERKTGTWLAVVDGGVGTTADSLNCNDVPQKAYRRDNPS